MNDVVTVRDTWAWDNERSRKIVRIGEQHFLISHSVHFDAEVAICRVDDSYDPHWDASAEFWARTGETIEDAEEALRGMTEEQYMSREVDRPDWDEVTWAFMSSGGRQ